MNFIYTTYRSAKNHADKTFDLVIMDEAHHITPNNAPYLMSIKASYWLNLSATVPYVKRALLVKLHGQTPMSVLRIPMKKAEDWGVLPRIEYLLLKVYTDHRQRNHSYHYRKTKKGEIQYMTYNKFQSLKYKGSNIIISCTEQEYIMMLDEEINYWIKLQEYLKEEQGEDVTWIWNTRIMPLGAKRKAFYAEIKGRVVIEELSELITMMRTVIFAERIEALKDSNITCIHSRQSTEENKIIISRFNNKEIHEIGAVNMLNESENLEDIQLAINLQLATQSKIINVQRQGRATRGKNPIVILPYIFGTKDERNCKKFMSDYSTKTFDTTEKLIEYVKRKIENQP